MKEWSGRVNNSSNKNFRVLLGLPLFIKYPMYDKYTEAPSRFNMPTVFDEVSRFQHFFVFLSIFLIGGALGWPCGRRTKNKINPTKS